MPRTAALALVAAAAALTLAGCGDDTAAGGGTVSARVDPSTIISANSTQQLGTVVVDGSVNTLYRYDQDSANPPTATCVDACAESWPPMLTDLASAPVLEGVQESAVGTVTRPDGSIQMTIGGWPVYRHAADSAPGTTEGNGVDGTWFAIKPDGTKAAQPESPN